MSLFAQLKRRNVLKVGAAYLIAAWLLIQVAATLAPQLQLPDWAPRLVTLLLMLGFPIALLMAWFLEHTPEGFRVEPAATGNRRIVVIAAALAALAVGWFLRESRQATAPEKGTEGIKVASTESAGPRVVDATLIPSVPFSPASRSIAVLPFVNMSGEAENEFFSDGLSEEILNSLARIDGMLVVGRTSSFQFKGQNEDLRIVGERLGVANVLEGSVRRSAARARITAQLVRASDGFHLWSQSYDRTLDDVFAVQMDIAEHVAGVLDVVLDDAQRERMREAGVRDVEAFIVYQKALALFADAHDAARSGDLIATLRLADVEFRRAVELEPGLTLAHFLATDLHDHVVLADSTPEAERAEAHRAAMDGLERASRSAGDPQQRLFIDLNRQMLSDDWRGLPARLETVLAATGCPAHNWLGQFVNPFGYAARSQDLLERLVRCDPLSVLAHQFRAGAANWSGQPQRVLDEVAASDHLVQEAPTVGVHRARALAALGRFDEARALLATFEMNEQVAIAALIVEAASGADAADLRAMLRAFDRTGSRVDAWSVVDFVGAALAGDSAEANRIAAIYDARPGRGLWLTVVADYCQCGAPFDLDATPNFRKRLEESGLAWPPPETIVYPRRAKATAMDAMR